MVMAINEIKEMAEADGIKIYTEEEVKQLLEKISQLENQLETIVEQHSKEIEQVKKEAEEKALKKAEKIMKFKEKYGLNDEQVEQLKKVIDDPDALTDFLLNLHTQSEEPDAHAVAEHSKKPDDLSPKEFVKRLREGRL
jgi:cell division septum initiation protein DivIVA